MGTSTHCLFKQIEICQVKNYNESGFRCAQIMSEIKCDLFKKGGARMAGVSIEIQPDILNWVMQKLQFQDVGKSIFDILREWQSGEKVPTFNQIEDVSKKTNIPLGYFFLEVPPIDDCEIIDFRTVNSISVDNPSRNLIDTVDAMSSVQEWMIDYYKTNGNEPFSYVGKFTDKVQAKTIALDIRKELGLDEEWFLSGKNAADSFRIAREAIGNIGVLVMANGVVGNNTHRKLDVNEFRAFTLLDKQVSLIFINSCDTDNGKIFSLFHELAHVWLGKDSFYNEPFGSTAVVSKLEVLCNAVAAELLVPDDIFDQKWNENQQEIFEKIQELAKYFRCSRFVITRRALDQNKISSDKYGAIVQELVKQSKRSLENAKKRSGGDFYRNLNSKWDKNFVAALAQSTESGKTLYTDAYHLTGTTGKTFVELVNRSGGV